MSAEIVLMYAITVIAALVWDANRRADARQGRVGQEEFDELIKDVARLEEELDRILAQVKRIDRERARLDDVEGVQQRMKLKLEELDVSVPDLKATVTQNANALAAVRTQLSAAFAGRNK